MAPVQAIVSFVGRFFLVAIFLISAVAQDIPHFNASVALMEKEGIPNVQLMLFGAIAFLIVGGLSVLFGFWSRLGAALLAVFLVLTMYYFHDFWTFTDPAERQMQMIHFFKNLSMLGGMLFIIANGGGAGAIDRRRVVLTV